jgi:chaperonin cofactor prefoldin
MQTPAPTSTLPTLAYVLLALATIFAGALGALINHLFNRPVQSASVHKTNAETGKTQAETRQIDSEILLRAFERLDDLETITREQNGQIIALERDKAEAEWKLSLSEQREKVHLEELRIANAELELLRKDRQPYTSQS